ncbi:MAG: polysaccharide deacetylase family protein [Pseudomonadota bacterium]
MRPRAAARPLAPLLAAALFAFPILATADAAVLGYHRFGQDQHPTTSIDHETLEAQLDYLEANDFRVWPLSRVVRALRDGETLPDRVVSLTIDDAYRTVYTDGWPRLRERGFPVTVFVSTGDVDRGYSDFMTWEQMRELADEGVEFANHSESHDRLPERRDGEDEAAWAERVEADIRHAERRLREELGDAAVVDDPKLFAYPYGAYNEALANRVRDMGYWGIAQHSGAVGEYSDPRALLRFPVGVTDYAMDKFRLRVNTRSLPVADVTPWDPETSKRRPTTTVTLAETPEHWRDLACYVSGQGEPARIEWEEDGERFTATPRGDLRPGIGHMNCTVPAGKGRFYWFSRLWWVVSDA